MKTIYLAGKIEGLTSEECLSWRAKLKSIVSSNYDKFSVLYNTKMENESYKEIWNKCYYLLDNSDMLLINFDYEENSPFLGTSMEIGRAHLQGKPIFIFSNKDWVHNNSTLKHHASKMFRNMEEAMEYINDNYSI